MESSIVHNANDNRSFKVLNTIGNYSRIIAGFYPKGPNYPTHANHTRLYFIPRHSRKSTASTPTIRKPLDHS